MKPKPIYSTNDGLLNGTLHGWIYEITVFRDSTGGPRDQAVRLRGMGLVFLEWANEELSNGILHDQNQWISKIHSTRISIWGSRGPPDRVRVTGLVFLDWANHGLSNGILHDQIPWI